jgi:hypothetical protein
MTSRRKDLTGDAADVAPLFTDFTAANLGVPQNLALPYLYPNTADQFGHVANPAGFSCRLSSGCFMFDDSLHG